MRIAYFSVSDQLGGSEIAMLDTIKAIRRQRPQWTMQAIIPGRGPLLARAEDAGADCVVLALPASLAKLGEFGAANAAHPLVARAALAVRLAPVAAALPSYLRNLRRVLRSLNPSILHTNGFKGHVLGARAGVPGKLVWHMHEYVGDRALTRSLLKSHASHPAAILANSASVATDVRRALSAPVEVDVVHNAVDLRAFAPEGPSDDLDERAGLARPSAPTVRVGLVATFARWKGHETFLRAIAALPRDLAIRAYVIGEPLYDTAGSQHTLDELRVCAAGLGIADRVGFTGFLRAPYAMRALDVVVHASTRPEPFGLVIAEAMACGRAVVTSATGGARELVQPGIDAIVHTPGDAASLGDAIARLATDSALRRELGVRARASACAKFDPDRLASETIAVYERLT